MAYPNLSQNMPLFDKVAKASDAAEYDRRNPEIWRKFKEIAFSLIETGVKHYGSRAIFEVIRFHRATSGDDAFKINNNLTAYYARKFKEAFPDHADFFETRDSRKGPCSYEKVG